MASSDEGAGTLPLEERPTPRRSQRNRVRVANLEIAQSSSDDEVVPSSQGGMRSYDGDNEEVPPSLPRHRYRTSDSDENQNKDDNSDVDEEFIASEHFSSDDEIPLASINAKKQPQKKSPSTNSSKKITNNSVSIVAQLFFFFLPVCLTHSLHCRYKEASDTVPKSS